MDDVQGENPGDLTCSVCIGAVNYNDAAANFTSRGPVTWTNTEFGDYPYDPGIGLIRPDVCAPGVDIKSLNYATNNGYTLMSGTSMATPCAAGCMALMLSKDINLAPADVCRILEETAVRLADGKSNTFGFGRIDVFQAVEAIQLGAVKYSGYALNDPMGNNNHKLNPGESVTIDLTLENVTDEPVSNVSVTLSTENEHITITDNTVDFPAFAANQTLTVADAFSFTADDQVVANERVRFNLAIAVDGEVTGNFNFNVDVYDYLLQYGTTVVLNDDNGNGLLNPGETADLRILVDNVGNEMAQMIVGTLSTDYELVTLNETEKPYSTIGAGMMAFADYNVTLSPDAPEDFAIPFVLDLVDAFGRHTILNFEYKNACDIIFSLVDSYGDGWQGNYLTVVYSDGTPTEQMTVGSGSTATYVRTVASGSTISLTWHNGQWTQECSFTITYDDGTVIYQNAGGFNGTQTFTINCAGGGAAPEFCDPVRNLAYEQDGLDVFLTWEAPETGVPTGYEVYRETELLTTTTELTYTDADMEEGLYNYCVYAVYADCQSEYVCVEAEVSMCGPVQNLTYTLNDDLLLTLTWDAPEDPTGLMEYQVYLDDEILASTNELTYAFTIAEGEHDVYVKAVFPSCEKDTHIAVCVVGAVQNLDCKIEGDQAVVTWDALEGVSEYEVYVNDVLVATVAETTYTFDAEPGMVTIMVKAVAESCYVLGVDTEACYIAPVSNLSFVVMDYGGLHFAWVSDDPNVEYYDVNYNGNTTQIAPQGGATGFSFDPIVGENTLCVTAHSIYGCDSEPVCMSKDVCAAVDGFDYSFVGNEVTVTWNGDADTYNLRINSFDWITVETNSYTTTVEGDLQIEVTPVYEECLAMTVTYWCAATNIAPEIRITDVREGLMATAWNTVDDAIAYNLYRDGEMIAEALAETTYNDTEMALNAEHCYAVQSVFEKGVSDLGEAACADYFSGVGENGTKVAIFPNPTSDKVTIQCEGMTLIEVYSAEGKLVRRVKVDGDHYQLDALESGAYTLRIRKGDEVLIRRVVKL